jgi:flagellar biosynthesis chaperone FliJ
MVAAHDRFHALLKDLSRQDPETAAQTLQELKLTCDALENALRQLYVDSLN